MRIVHRHRHLCRYQAHDPCPVKTKGKVPPFARPLGVDIIITAEGKAVLIELQHGFGRLGLIKLFPGANRRYRQRFRSLLREHGTCFEIRARIKEICSDKIETYKHFSEFQPSSLPYKGWTGKVERWLSALSSELVLAKPPRGSCGKGIEVLRRAELLRDPESRRLGPVLLQEFVRSRPILDEQGLAHFGCIRHIVLISGDGESLELLHLPSYWRVAPVAQEADADHSARAALTANISQGAFPLGVEDYEEQLVRSLTEEVCRSLIEEVLELENIPLRPSLVIPADGSLPVEASASRTTPLRPR